MRPFETQSGKRGRRSREYIRERLAVRGGGQGWSETVKSSLGAASPNMGLPARDGPHAIGVPSCHSPTSAPPPRPRIPSSCVKSTSCLSAFTPFGNSPFPSAVFLSSLPISSLESKFLKGESGFKLTSIIPELSPVPGWYQMVKPELPWSYWRAC